MKAVENFFASSLYFSAGALARVVERLAIECWKPAGISPSQGQILVYMLSCAKSQPTGTNMIARNLRLSPSTVTRLLDGLEKKGLVLRFVYDNFRMVCPSLKASDLQDTLDQCDFDFARRCAELLGEDGPGICQFLNETTDRLANPDIYSPKKTNMDIPERGRKIEPVYLVEAITYEAYVALIDELVATGRTTGPDQSEAFVHYTALNQQRMHRIGKLLVVDPTAAEMIQSVTLPQTWLVLTEAWCGDAAQSLPVMHALAMLNPVISLRLLMRDEHPELMDRYLTNGVSRSIPKLIGIDTLTGEELFTWGPRPSVLQEIFYRMKGEGVEYHAIKEELQRWYNKDKTLSIQLELATAASGAVNTDVGMTA